MLKFYLLDKRAAWLWIVVVKCSITKNKSGFLSASDSELLPLCGMKFLFYSSHSFPIFAWGMCRVLALCHGGTTNRRYSISKGICQVRDRSKALQGMTAGCAYRPHKTFLSVFSSLPSLASQLYICISESSRRHLNHISTTLYLHGI